MNSTNVSYYAAGFDKSGHRVVTKICDYDPAKSKHDDEIAALLDDIKATSSDVIVAEIISADDFYLYTNENYVRDSATGKPIPYVPPEPTKLEKISYIKKYYDARFATLDKALARRQLINGDITDLKAQYQKLNAEMIAKIKEVD